MSRGFCFNRLISALLQFTLALRLISCCSGRLWIISSCWYDLLSSCCGWIWLNYCDRKTLAHINIFAVRIEVVHGFCIYPDLIEAQAWIKLDTIVPPIWVSLLELDWPSLSLSRPWSARFLSICVVVSGLLLQMLSFFHQQIWSIFVDRFLLGRSKNSVVALAQSVLSWYLCRYLHNRLSQLMHLHFDD